MNEEQMERNLDRINMWIGNCDQKASFLLAFVGVAATVFITSDVVSTIKRIIIDPFIAYWSFHEGSFSFYRLLIAACLVFGSGSIFLALINLLYCLMAKTDYSKFKQPGMKEQSRLFYGHISSMSYSEFCQEDSEIIKDLQSQTYTNACICDSKFKHYNKGLKQVFVAIFFLALVFVLILFV